MRRGAWLLVVAASMGLGERAASAADVPSLNLRRLELPSDPAGLLYTEPATAPGPLNWNAAIVASYAQRAVVLEDDSGAELAVPVKNQFSVDYLFSIGLGERVALGLALPSVLYQRGTSLEGDVTGAAPLPKSALGDVGLSAKAVLLPAGDLGGLSVAGLAKVTLPTGDPTSYISEDSATGELRVLSELNLVALSLRLTLGAKVRGEEVSYGADTFGHSLPWGAAVLLRPQAFGWDDQGYWSWAVETHGAVALTPSFGAAADSPASIGAAARYTPSELSVLMGVEVPFAWAVGEPVVRGVLGIGWAPRFLDADEDGIEDAKDECAELAEDRDGFQDSDGCPDFDNDDDGVGDEDDKCPHEKEDADGFEDEDGCLDPDDDHDGIPDVKDACPREAGPDSPDPKRRGCALRDRDIDGIFDPDDKCPKKAEDRDGFEDQDGCPDPDNDQDGVPDLDDACPDKPGAVRSDAKLSGCPSPDQDRDAIDDGDDKCPNSPENFDNFEDLDGCPDDVAGARPRPPVARFDDKSESVVVARPLAFEKAPHEPQPARTAPRLPCPGPALRAVAALSNGRPGSILLVGVRPRDKSAAAQQEALERSSGIVLALRRFTHRDDVAETVSFAAVAKLPGAAASGVGLGVTSAAARSGAKVKLKLKANDKP